MDGSIAKGLGTAILILLIIVGGIAGLGAFFIGKRIYKTDSIKSDKPINPELQLIIKDNKVDTLFIYRKPH